MYQPHTLPYSNGTVVQAPAGPYPTAPQGTAYPAMQPLYAPEQAQQQQQAPHYPSVQPLVAGLHEQQHQEQQPSAPPLHQAHRTSYTQQYNQAYPSTPQPQHQHMGNSYAPLTDQMHNMTLQQPPAASANTNAPYAPQQQQGLHRPSYPGSYPPSSPQQQPQSAHAPPYPPQQQQQQAYPQHTPYLHTSSGNSQQYGSFNGAASFGGSSLGSSIGGGWAGAASPARHPSTLSSGSFGDQRQYDQQQYEQLAAPLPPYPAVPQALPVMPYNAPPEQVCQGYDVMIYIQNATNLPAMDWWNGLADPYVIVTSHVGGQNFEYRTAHKRRTVNPEFENEFFQVGNLPANTTFFVEAWDKDMVTDDDVIGRATWTFNPREMLPASTAGGGLLSEDQSWGRLLVKLPLRHPSKQKKAAGEIELEVCYRPSTRVGKPRMLGPVRFRQHLSPTAGVFTGHWWSNADNMSFLTYKLFLINIPATFDGVKMPWNKKYDKAVAIFKNPVVLGGIRTQHSALYSTHMGSNRGGLLSCAADFFELFGNGIRGGQRRFFTYVLCEDSFRCSETGAAFFNDMFSKHAMHSGGAEEVLYAGEFCIVPCPGASGGHKLVIDNNSGTYAPDKSKLPRMKKLFESNFPDMTVEVLDMGDPKLKEYQLACPSRSGLTGAAAAAAAAGNTAGTGSGGGRSS